MSEDERRIHDIALICTLLTLLKSEQEKGISVTNVAAEYDHAIELVKEELL